MTPCSVLVLDNFPQTLAVVRSLGEAGYDVILGYEHNKPDAGLSRYCSEKWLHPELVDANAFSAAVLNLLDDRPEICWIFPVTEPSIKLMQDIADVIPEGVQIAMVPQQQFLLSIDKQQSNDFAENAGITYPKSRVVENHGELCDAVHDIGYPIIIKSDQTTHRVFGHKAYLVKSEEEFQSVFSTWPAEHANLLVQKYIAGEVVGADYVARQGELVAYTQGGRVRTDMLDGTGYAVDFITEAPDADVLDATRVFLRACEYSGPGLVQFIRDKDSGKLYFLENNPRLSAGIAQIVSAGVDFPVLALQSLDVMVEHNLEEIGSDVPHYVIGMRTYWLSRDIEGYLSEQRFLSKKERRKWLSDSFGSFMSADNHIMWRWSDPLPGFRIILRLGRRLILEQLFDVNN